MSSTPARTSLLALAMAVVSAGALSAQQAGPEAEPPEGAQFVYINSQQLLQQAPGATEAQQTWQQEMARYRTEVQQLQTELDSLQQEYQRREGMLSEEARQRRQEEIAQKRQQLQSRVQELEQQAQQRQQELLGPILEQVQDVIADLRAERGFTMVFDANAAGLLAADPRLDITGLVVERLRESQGDGDGGQDGGDAGGGSGGS